MHGRHARRALRPAFTPARRAAAAADRARARRHRLHAAARRGRRRDAAGAFACGRAWSPRCCGSTTTSGGSRSRSTGSKSCIDERLARTTCDRGARRLRQQTRFLAEAFREYERRVRVAAPATNTSCANVCWRGRRRTASSRDRDRRRLDCRCRRAVRRRLRSADPHPAPRDDRHRRDGSASWVRVSTSAFTLVAWHRGDRSTRRRRRARPILSARPDASADEPWWTLRDREEELVAVARRLKASAVAANRCARIGRRRVQAAAAVPATWRGKCLAPRGSRTRRSTRFRSPPSRRRRRSIWSSTPSAQRSRATRSRAPSIAAPSVRD